MISRQFDATLPLADQLVGLVNRALAIADLTADTNTREQLHVLASDLQSTEMSASRHEQQAREMELSLDDLVENARQIAQQLDHLVWLAKQSEKLTKAAQESGGRVVLVSKWFPRTEVPLDGGPA